MQAELRQGCVLGAHVFQNGVEVRPEKAQVYDILIGTTEMRAFPAGLRMIAGDAHAVRPQSTKIVYWTCGGRAVQTRPSATPPEHCGVLPGLRARVRIGNRTSVIQMRSKSFLELHVVFPDCWDGKHLDSADHKSHMAYSRLYVCPASHPVKVPRIRLSIRYPIRSGTNVTLASGGQLSGHADFFNAWDERALTRLVDDCFHGRPCNEPRH